jgi:hypothetical protein
MNQDVPESRLPRRCGNCRHAVRSTALDGSVIACIVLLEYHCADRISDCGSYRPPDEAPEDEGND